MHNSKVLLTAVGFLICQLGQTQWKPDSILTYISFGGKTTVSSVEYYSYDTKDSISTIKLVEYTAGIKNPLQLQTYSYAKVKKGSERKIIYANWDKANQTFVSNYQSIRVVSKNGNMLSSVNQLIRHDGAVLNETKVENVYNQMSQLTRTSFYRWSQLKQQWIMETQTQYTYLNNQEEVLEMQFDSVSNSMKPINKSAIYFKENGRLEETISYDAVGKAWLPKERFLYGYDTTANIEGQVVQRFNCSKSNWDNKFYYVKKYNDKGQVDAEIHMHWSGKDWLVDLSYTYVYNEYGDLIQILNEKKEVLISRYGHVR